MFGCVTWLVGGCERSAPAPEANEAELRQVDRPPNILLITACTFRYDYMSGAGYPRKTTPFLDSLAEKGVFFENAISASSWTQPSVASILTGLTPNVHRMQHPTTQIQGTSDEERTRQLAKRRLHDDVVTIAELLGQAGYATFCRINNVQAGHFFNIPQGFEDGLTVRWWTRRLLEDLSAWLAKREHERPFFAFIMTRDMHKPFKPRYSNYLRFNRSSTVLSEEAYKTYPKELHKRLTALPSSEIAEDIKRDYTDLYAAEMAQLDDVLSRIPDMLKEAGCDDNTVIVVTGDHGETFFEPGRSQSTGHAFDLFEELVHVPLIITGANIPAGRRINHVVRTIDIYPTLAALGRVTVPDVVQGTNLLPFIEGTADTLPALSAFSSFTRKQRMIHAVRNGRYKLFSNGQLYDLQTDPRELKNIAQEYPDIAKRLDDEMTRWLAQEEQLRSKIEAGAMKTLTPEVLEELRSLGYLGD